MKQYRFGQKVQNWHRPLGKDEWSAAYLRWRVDGAMEDLREEDGVVDIWARDDSDEERFLCNALHSRLVRNLWQIVQLNGGYRSDISALFSRDLCVLLQRLILGAPLREYLEWERNADTISRMRNLLFRDNNDCRTEDLIDWMHTLIHVPRYPELLQGRILQALDSYQEASTILQYAELYSYDPLTSILALCFAPFWHRRPSTWNREENPSLFAHLFEEYPIPGFLHQIFTTDRWPPLMFFLLFVAYGRGMSISRLAQALDWNMSESLVRQLPKIPANTALRHVMLCAEVLSAEGTVEDFDHLYDLYEIWIESEDMSDPINIHYWRENVRFFTKEGRHLDSFQRVQIANWMDHCRSVDPHFTMRGRTARACLTRATNWLRMRMVRENRMLQWEPLGWEWQGVDNQNITWSVCELTNSLQLLEEGLAMHHCIASYDKKCCSGKSRVFSVRRNAERSATVEIDARKKEIQDCRAKCNHDPDERTKLVIYYWMTHFLLFH